MDLWCDWLVVELIRRSLMRFGDQTQLIIIHSRDNDIQLPQNNDFTRILSRAHSINIDWFSL